MASIYGSDKIEFKREELISVPDDIYTYQTEYNKLKGDGKRTEVIPPDPLEFKYLFDDMIYIDPVRNKLALQQGESYYETEEEEEQILYRPQGRVMINGIEFKAKDLYIFRLSLFLNIVSHALELSPNEPIIISYLTIKDLYLIKDWLRGRIMVGVLYQELSQTGFDYLSGRRTVLELSEEVSYRKTLDSRFSLGKSFYDYW